MPFSTTYARFKSFVNGGSLLPSDLNSIQDDFGNQLAGVNVAGGFNEGANVRRGKFIQPAAGTRTNVAYGALSNGPDQVANIVLPSDGLIWFFYQAIWQEQFAATARAGVFINGVQLKGGPFPTGAVVDASIGSGGPNVNAPLGTYPSFGLISGPANAATAEQTSGMVVGGINGVAGTGGPVTIWLPSGTHTISVQYKASSGVVTVKDRRMWVSTESFG